MTQLILNFLLCLAIGINQYQIYVLTKEIENMKREPLIDIADLIREADENERW